MFLTRILTLFGFCPKLGALVNGPLFSLEASGQVGHALVFAKWKGREYCRKYTVPKNPRSLAQTFQRGILESLSKWWRYITPTHQATWQTRANAHNYSTFNAFTKFNLDGETDGDFPESTADNTGTANSGVVATVTIAGGLNKIDVSVTLTGDDVNAEDLLIVTLSTPGGIASTAHTIQRTVHGRPNLISEGVYEMDMLNIPPGTYRVSANIIGGSGEASGWVDSAGSVVVTGA